MARLRLTVASSPVFTLLPTSVRQRADCSEDEVCVVPPQQGSGAAQSRQGVRPPEGHLPTENSQMGSLRLCAPQRHLPGLEATRSEPRARQSRGRAKAMGSFGALGLTTLTRKHQALAAMCRRKLKVFPWLGTRGDKEVPDLRLPCTQVAVQKDPSEPALMAKDQNACSGVMENFATPALL